jgi:hypothetical protein
MNRALVGTLLVTCLTVGCSKDQEVEKTAEKSVKRSPKKPAPAKKAAAERTRLAAPEPPVEGCTMAMSEPHLTFQNGLKASDKPNEKPYTGTTDATIEKETPTANAGSGEYLSAKGGKKPRHGLVRWDLSSVPADTTIKGACLAVFVEDPSSESYSGYELLREWSEGQVTWTHASTATPWEEPGARGAKDSGADVVHIPRRAPGLQTVPLPTSLVQKWIKEKATNHGIVFANDKSYNGVTFWSANSATASQRPTLLIWK